MHSVSVKNLTLNFGSVSVLKNLNLDVAEGEFVVLLGPSGCGKSTLLNCLAGLLDISEGEIWIKNKNVTWAEPSERGIGMVFQSYALYPQMTVRGNLSFGLKIAKIPAAEIEKRVARATEILQIGPLLDRKPGALSGGQRQRVAIGRALVRDVDVFLFDEPLSNLDAKLRADLRVEIKRLHRRLKNTMIYVTHDQIEALTLADRIAVMKSGVIQQLASPDEIYNRPVSKYVAGFIGSPEINFLDGLLERTVFHSGDIKMDVSRYPFVKQPGGPAWFGVRPEAVKTGDAAKECPVTLETVVEIVEPMGSDTLVWTKVAGQDFRLRMEGHAKVAHGDALQIGFDPIRASIFDKGTEERL